MSRQELVRAFHDAMRASDLWGAMRVLNAASTYRFSAVFAFAGGTLHNLCLVDKEDLTLMRCDDQPVEQSYCVYVQQTQHIVGIQHAAEDDRTTGHPKRALFQAYYGVPLLSQAGALLGTICHFNETPGTLTEEAMDLLADAAGAIAQQIETSSGPA